MKVQRKTEHCNIILIEQQLLSNNLILKVYLQTLFKSYSSITIPIQFGHPINQMTSFDLTIIIKIINII